MRKKVKVESHLVDIPIDWVGMIHKLEQQYGTNRLYEDCWNFIVPCSPTGRLNQTKHNSLLDDFQSKGRIMRSSKTPEVRFISLEMDFSEIERRVSQATDNKRFDDAA